MTLFSECLLILVISGVGSFSSAKAASVVYQSVDDNYLIPSSIAAESANKFRRYSATPAMATIPTKHTSSADSPSIVGKSVIDQFSHRYPDGSYEFRYELGDGTARYERGYFVLIDKVKSLVVVGYYSYRMPDGRYITVFYNADNFGYRQNQSITSQVYPDLPRSIEVQGTSESGVSQ